MIENIDKNTALQIKLQKNSELRDYFAGLAMQAIIGNEELRQEMCDKASKYLVNNIDVDFTLDVYAQGAYLIADAMLKARKDNV